MKMNHNYLNSRCAPPPCKPFQEVISEEGVDEHLPSSEEGVL